MDLSIATAWISKLTKNNLQYIQEIKNQIIRKEKKRLELLHLVAGRAGLPDYMIEKNFWVTAVPVALFTGSFKDNHAFKSDTSAVGHGRY